MQNVSLAKKNLKDKNYSFSMLVDKTVKLGQKDTNKDVEKDEKERERDRERDRDRERERERDRERVEKAERAEREDKKISKNTHPTMSYQEVKKEKSLLSQVAHATSSITMAASAFTLKEKESKDKDRYGVNINDINSIESRRVHTWVRDSTIHNCYSCKIGFTIVNRKHHCRLCGRIFCSECTQYRQKIPFFLTHYLPRRNDENPSFSKLIADSDKTLGTTLKNIKSAVKTDREVISIEKKEVEKDKSEANDEMKYIKIRNYGSITQSDTKGATMMLNQYMDSTASSSSENIDALDKDDDSNRNNNNSNNDYTQNNRNIDDSTPQRLCKPCFIRLNELTHLRYLIDLFGVVGTTIKDLKTYSLVCKDWSQIASYHLSSFREMQYYLPNHRFSKYDRQMLWDNRFYLFNHGTWLTQLIRSIDYNEDGEKVKELIKLLNLSENKSINILNINNSSNNNNSNNNSNNNNSNNNNSNDNNGNNNSNDNNIDGDNNNNNINKGIGLELELELEIEKYVNTDFKRSLINNNRKTDNQDYIGSANQESLRGNTSSTINNDYSYNINDSAKVNVSCWSLMCTRTCQKHLRAEDAVLLLDYHTQSAELRLWAMNELVTKTELDELRLYLPILVHHIRYESIEQSVIGKGLINLVSKRKYKGNSLMVNKQLMLANDLYWQLTVETENRTYQQIYRYFLDQFCNNMDKNVMAVIFKGKSANSVMHSTTIKKTSNDFTKNSNSNNNYLTKVNNSFVNFTEEQIKHVLSLHLKNDTFVSPTNPFLTYLNFNIDKIKQTDSNSKPVILPYKIQNITGGTTDKNVLYKNEDLRKDKIIMNLIKLSDLILKKEENLELGLITYEICPTTASNGFLEMVPKSKTLYDIKERLNLSINNYIDSYNDNVLVNDLRNRFVRSCAGYCVITYLLGIGDRHLDNIMITEDGYIFHIDYGFILGADPKPMTKPKMRITDDMVTALGGMDSKYYQEFKDISNRVYNCLRRHINLFISMLSLLIDADPVIKNKTEITRELLLKEIYKRFVPGETYSEAQILLETEIHNSNRIYTHAINDFFHYHAKEKTLKTALNSGFKSIKGFFK